MHTNWIQDNLYYEILYNVAFPAKLRYQWLLCNSLIGKQQTGAACTLKTIGLQAYPLPGPPGTRVPPPTIPPWYPGSFPKHTPPSFMVPGVLLRRGVEFAGREWPSWGGAIRLSKFYTPGVGGHPACPAYTPLLLNLVDSITTRAVPRDLLVVALLPPPSLKRKHVNFQSNPSSPAAPVWRVNRFPSFGFDVKKVQIQTKTWAFQKS